MDVGGNACARQRHARARLMSDQQNQDPKRAMHKQSKQIAHARYVTSRLCIPERELLNLGYKLYSAFGNPRVAARQRSLLRPVKPIVTASLKMPKSKHVSFPGCTNVI